MYLATVVTKDDYDCIIDDGIETMIDYAEMQMQCIPMLSANDANIERLKSILIGELRDVREMTSDDELEVTWSEACVADVREITCKEQGSEERLGVILIRKYIGEVFA